LFVQKRKEESGDGSIKIHWRSELQERLECVVHTAVQILDLPGRMAVFAKGYKTCEPQLINLKNEDINSLHVCFIIRNIIGKLNLRYQGGLIISKGKNCSGLFMFPFLGPNSYTKQIPWFHFIAII